MSGEGSQGNREVPQQNRPLKEGGSWGKHGFPHGSEPEASDGHGNSPRASSAAATSRIPVTSAAWRNVSPRASESSQTRSKASPILSASRARMSSRSQKS